MTVIQESDRFYIQRISSRLKTNYALEATQLREFVEETQLSLHTDVVDRIDVLEEKVDNLEGWIEVIIGDPIADGDFGGLIKDLNDLILEKESDRKAADLDHDVDIQKLDTRIQRLEEFSSINAFYYLQDPSDYTSNILTGGMAFDSVVDKDITGIKLNTSDLRDTEFSYVNISAGEKIEIIRFDSNNTVRKRLLFNIEDVTPPSPGVDYVTLVVTYLFSTSLQTLSLQEIIDSYDPDPSVPTSEYEMRVEVFPAFDSSGAVTQTYVDNKVDDLDVKLTAEIKKVDDKSGVSKIVPGNGITVSSNTGEVTITAVPVIQPYDLPVAKTGHLGGVKISSLSGSVVPAVGINDSEKLVVQESTSTSRGVNYKGQCCVMSGNNIPNTSDFRQGQMIWHTGNNVLYIVT